MNLKYANDLVEALEPILNEIARLDRAVKALQLSRQKVDANLWPIEGDPLDLVYPEQS